MVAGASHGSRRVLACSTSSMKTRQARSLATTSHVRCGSPVVVTEVLVVRARPRPGAVPCASSRPCGHPRPRRSPDPHRPLGGRRRASVSRLGRPGPADWRLTPGLSLGGGPERGPRSPCQPGSRGRAGRRPAAVEAGRSSVAVRRGPRGLGCRDDVRRDRGCRSRGCSGHGRCDRGCRGLGRAAVVHVEARGRGCPGGPHHPHEEVVALGARRAARREVPRAAPRRPAP